MEGLRPASPAAMTPPGGAYRTTVLRLVAHVKVHPVGFRTAPLDLDLAPDQVAPVSDLSARMPPSPWLSARMTKRQYFTEMVMTSAQKTSDRIPSAACGVNLTPRVWTTVSSV